MALKMLYRGPSSRLETLIEKIQQNKDSPGMVHIFLDFYINHMILIYHQQQIKTHSLLAFQKYHSFNQLYNLLTSFNSPLN